MMRSFVQGFETSIALPSKSTVSPSSIVWWSKSKLLPSSTVTQHTFNLKGPSVLANRGAQGPIFQEKAYLWWRRQSPPHLNETLQMLSECHMCMSSLCSTLIQFRLPSLCSSLILQFYRVSGLSLLSGNAKSFLDKWFLVPNKRVKYCANFGHVYSVFIKTNSSKTLFSC